MEGVGTPCEYTKCNVWSLNFSIFCPLCKDVFYCSEKCRTIDKIVHKNRCRFILKSIEERIGNNNIDPCELFLSEIATNQKLVEELHKYFFKKYFIENKGPGILFLSRESRDELRELRKSGNERSINPEWFIFKSIQEIKDMANVYKKLEQATSKIVCTEPYKEKTFAILIAIIKEDICLEVYVKILRVNQTLTKEQFNQINK